MDFTTTSLIYDKVEDCLIKSRDIELYDFLKFHGLSIFVQTVGNKQVYIEVYDCDDEIIILGYVDRVEAYWE